MTSMYVPDNYQEIERLQARVTELEAVVRGAQRIVNHAAPDNYYAQERNEWHTQARAAIAAMAVVEEEPAETGADWVEEDCPNCGKTLHIELDPAQSG